jgi:hypothetical protein
MDQGFLPAYSIFYFIRTYRVMFNFGEKMKTLLTFLLLFLFVSIGFSQEKLSKGTINLGGTLSFSSTSYDGSDYSYDVLLLKPQVGFFIVNNFSIGLETKYERMSFGEDNASGEWGIGPAFRYYFYLENINPFIGIGVFYSERDLGDEYENYQYYDFNFSGGFDVFIAENVAIETLFNYGIKNTINPEANRPNVNTAEKLRILFLGVGIIVFI